MAQPGLQTTLTYGSLVPGQVPSPANLVTSVSGVELAINAADGKLFYKDINGNVQTLADINIQGAQGIASITGGSINNTVIGDLVPASGSFTQLITNSLALPSLVGMLKSNGNLGLSVAVPGYDYVSGSMVASPNGVASLDTNGKVPLSQLPDSVTGSLVYLGTWNASTNQPNLTSGVGVKGQFYKVNVPGNTNIDGESTWLIGDQIVFDGTKWERIAESTAPVTSVNGMIGAVMITKDGLGAAGAGANFDITSISGMTTPLSVSQGGTGSTSLTGLVKAQGTSSMTAAVPGVDYAVPPNGTVTQLLANNGTGGFTNVTLGTGLQYSGGVLTATATGSAGGTVTSVQVSGGSTGITFSGGPVTSAGTITMTGTLAVSNGGTGRTSMSGLLKGNGSSAIVSAVPGTDYAVPPNGGSAQLLANNGTGGFTNVTIGAGLQFSGGVLSSTGGGGSGPGSVTSVDASGGSTGLTFSGGPVTSSGTLTLSGRLNVASGGTGTTTLNGILKGNGTSAIGSATPGIDYALPPTGANTVLLASNGVGGFQEVTVGAGLQFSSGVLAVTGGSGGSGSVTSVAASGGTTGLTFTGSPITSSGTLTLSGTLNVSNGGTGRTTLSGILKGTGTASIATAVPGTDYAVPPSASSSQLLTGNGSGGFGAVNIGSGLQLIGGTLTATGSGGSGGSSSHRRIVVLGDSLTAQQPLFSRPWPGILEDNLRASGVDVEIMNVAINGWSFYKANTTVAFGTKTMVQKAIEFNPELVIVALGFNDTLFEVDSRTLATAKSDAATLFSAFKSALPSCKIMYLGQTPYDTQHGTPSNLINMRTMPIFWTLPTSGILTNCYAMESRSDATSALVKSRTANWLELDTYIRGLSTVDIKDTLPIWKTARMGCCGSDGLHFNQSGHFFLGASVRKIFKTNTELKALYQDLSNQAYETFDDPDVLFNAYLVSSGGNWESREELGMTVTHPSGYFGTFTAFNPFVWYYPTKPSVITSNRVSYTAGQPYLWLIQGAAPHTTVQASLNGAAWFNAHIKTDARGNFADNGIIDFPSNGTYTFRYKVGNEVYGPFPIVVSGVGGNTGAAKGLGQLWGLSGQYTATANRFTPIYYSTSGALQINGVTASGSGSGFGPGLVVSKTGRYRIGASVMATANSSTPTGIFLRVVINRGGSEVEISDGSTSYNLDIAGFAMMSQTSFIYYLNAGDKVAAKLFVFGGSATETNSATTTGNWLHVEEI